jgi:hypothetical protein
MYLTINNPSSDGTATSAGSEGLRGPHRFHSDPVSIGPFLKLRGAPVTNNGAYARPVRAVGRGNFVSEAMGERDGIVRRSLR